MTREPLTISTNVVATRWSLFLGSILLGLVIAVMVLILRSDSYRASQLVQFETPKLANVDYPSNAEGHFARDAELAVTSRIEELDPNIDVTSYPESEPLMLKVGFRNPVPREAYQSLLKLLDQIEEEFSNQLETALAVRREELATQRIKVEQLIEESQNRLVEIDEQMRAIPQPAGLLNSPDTDLDMQLVTASRQANELAREARHLRELLALPGMPSERLTKLADANEDLRPLIDMLRQAHRQLANDELRLQPEHPLIQNQRGMVVQLENDLREQMEQQQLAVEELLTEARQQQLAIQRVRDTERERRSQLPRLEREKAKVESDLLRYREHLEKIERELGTVNGFTPTSIQPVKRVGSPEVAAIPFRLGITGLLGLGACGGLVLGWCLVWACGPVAPMRVESADSPMQRNTWANRPPEIPIPDPLLPSSADSRPTVDMQRLAAESNRVAMETFFAPEEIDWPELDELEFSELDQLDPATESDEVLVDWEAAKSASEVKVRGETRGPDSGEDFGEQDSAEDVGQPDSTEDWEEEVTPEVVFAESARVESRMAKAFSGSSLKPQRRRVGEMSADRWA